MQPGLNIMPLKRATSWYFSVVVTKLHKATTSFLMSVCLSVCMEELGSHWMHFHEIWY